MATADYNGVQKAAILLITLGPERSADIFKHLFTYYKLSHNIFRVLSPCHQMDFSHDYWI